MIKRIGIYSIPEGTDEKQWWHYHSKVHAADFIKAAGDDLAKYVINRVTKVIKGEKICFGIVETWYEDEAAMKRVYERCYQTILPSGKNIDDDYFSRVVNANSFAVEEVVVKD